MNNCVGVRNHFYFLCFLGGVVGLGVTVMGGTMVGMQYQAMDMGPQDGPGTHAHPPPPPPNNITGLPDSDGMTIVLSVLTVPVSVLTLILLVRAQPMRWLSISRGLSLQQLLHSITYGWMSRDKTLR